MIYSAQPSIPAIQLVLPAWAIFWLGIALIVGLSNKRRASILVDLFILLLVGVFIAQLFVAYSRPEFYLDLHRQFAFIPVRYEADDGYIAALDVWLAYLYTPFTYAYLHLNGLHMFGNCMALFVFGRTVAWRLGGAGFLLLFSFACAAGALTHWAFYPDSEAPLIGASAGAFGVLGATFRFVPRAEDRLRALFWPDEKLRQPPLAGIGEMLTDRRSQIYILLCIIIYPLGLIALLAGSAGNTAVLAHLGGFAFGLFGVEYFDRYRPAYRPPRQAEQPADKKPEPLGLRVLRVIAVILMVVGIIMGLGFYYYPFLSWGF